MPRAKVSSTSISFGQRFIRRRDRQARSEFAFSNRCRCRASTVFPAWTVRIAACRWSGVVSLRIRLRRSGSLCGSVVEKVAKNGQPGTGRAFGGRLTEARRSDGSPRCCSTRRHPDVHQDDVGPTIPLDEADGVASVAALLIMYHVRLRIDDYCVAGAEERLGHHHQHADHRVDRVPAGGGKGTWANGREDISVRGVAWRRISRRPPTAARRRCMPARHPGFQVRPGGWVGDGIADFDPEQVVAQLCSTQIHPFFARVERRPGQHLLKNMAVTTSGS